jgi:phage-related protein
MGWGIDDIGDSISSGFESATDAVGDVVEGAGDAISSGFSKVRSGLSDAWGSVDSAVSDAWGDVKGGIRDVTGYDSLNQLATEGLLTGGILPATKTAANLGGQALNELGLLGGQQQPMQQAGLNPANNPMLNQPNMGGGGMTFGSAGNWQNTQQQAGRDIGSIMGADGGRQGEGSPNISAALLRANPEAYQVQPLFPTA